jgi:hypothetical protein
MNTIKVKPWGKGQGEFVLIDEDSFNPEFHTLYGEAPEGTPEGTPKPERKPKQQ